MNRSLATSHVDQTVYGHFTDFTECFIRFYRQSCTDNRKKKKVRLLTGARIDIRRIRTRVTRALKSPLNRDAVDRGALYLRPPRSPAARSAFLRVARVANRGETRALPAHGFPAALYNTTPGTSALDAESHWTEPSTQCITARLVHLATYEHPARATESYDLGERDREELSLRVAFWPREEEKYGKKKKKEKKRKKKRRRRGRNGLL
ncbi:hypothetical protein PUN28_006633 [Cardiocondyla obscurior]|uniref:Uncharacterized protein n=1 Tax=Cardiocondyla obscurior TaxID=286306 RepID=A0AAW2GC34_9HYME